MGLPVAEFNDLGIHLLGASLAGEETYLVLPELNLAFDVGRAPREVLAVDHVFLSHGHMDHAAGIAYYFSQRMFVDNQPGTVYVPAGLDGPLHELLRIWAQIDGQEPAANIVVARPGQDVSLRRDLVVRPFEVNHPSRRRERGVVRALGFSAIEVRHKLLPQHEGLTGPQIVELKTQGVPITRRVEAPLVCYCGDTAPGDFFELDYVRAARLLLLECTFFDPDHIRRARQGNHMHVRDLRDVLPKLRNERILLTHLSRRTSLAEARAHLRRELGPDVDPRLSFLMEYRRRRPARGPRPAP
jgi:ribonuclease Z